MPFLLICFWQALQRQISIAWNKTMSPLTGMYQKCIICLLKGTRHKESIAQQNVKMSLAAAGTECNVFADEGGG